MQHIMGTLVLLLMIGVTFAQAAGTCTTEEQRAAAVQERLDTLQCENFICALRRVNLGPAASIGLWPDGTYSLPQATQGCPTGWSSGWRYQDNQNTNNDNSWSPSDLTSYMRMDVGSNFRTYYCTKTSNGSTGSSVWPSGRYCIARHGGRCPSGFSNGSIYWDDEDNSNSNSKQDPLPDGEYGGDTQVYYCCRSDGSASVGIELPTSQPFILYRHGGTCQTVRGMTVRQLYVHFDDEDSVNINRCSGSYPDDSSCDSDHDIYFCYYSTSM